MITYDGIPLNHLFLGDDTLTSDELTLGGVTDFARLPLADDRDGAELFAAYLAQVRRVRDGRLAACDWTQLPDADLTPERAEAWRRYRQRLRDLPATLTQDDLWRAQYPEPPEG
ncbi:MAG: phage tail assembly chaperone [Christensenellales bacterium]|jgi:hypothetical protein